MLLLLRRTASNSGSAPIRSNHARLNAFTYQSIKNILSAGLDRVALEDDGTAPTQGLAHDNIRGATYYVASQEDNEC